MVEALEPRSKIAADMDTDIPRYIAQICMYGVFCLTNSMAHTKVPEISNVGQDKLV